VELRPAQTARSSASSARRGHRSLDEIEAPGAPAERAFLALGARSGRVCIGFLLDPALLGRLVGLAFEDANAFVEIRAPTAGSRSSAS
jgi:hypothetical protein